MITTNPYGIGRVGIATHCPLSIQCPIISIWYTQCQLTAMLRFFKTRLMRGIIFPISISGNVPTLCPPTDPGSAALRVSTRLYVHQWLQQPDSLQQRNILSAPAPPAPAVAQGCLGDLQTDLECPSFFQIRLKVRHKIYSIHWFHS